MNGFRTVWNGKMVLVRDEPVSVGSAFVNPEAHLTMYGLGNPFVVEAIRLGAYDDVCPRCTVMVRDEAGVARRVTLGKVPSHPGTRCEACEPMVGSDAAGGRVVVSRPGCQRVCPECGGSKGRRE
jgi:hypothetical protein